MNFSAFIRHCLSVAVLLFLTLFASGCSTTESVKRPDPDYRPIAGNSYGYSDRRIKENSYEVTYKGHEKTSQQEANDFARLRALEIARKLNYKYMLVTSTKDKTSSRNKNYNGYCYPNFMTGGQSCVSGGSKTLSFAGVTLKVQFFDAKPKGRYLTENLLEVDVWYLALSANYGLPVE